MIIKIDTRRRQIIVGEEPLLLGDIFNLLHMLDADNVDKWTVRKEYVKPSINIT